jgi:hypothetical protein
MLSGKTMRVVRDEFHLCERGGLLVRLGQSDRRSTDLD